jgi:hypothetical protein
MWALLAAVVLILAGGVAQAQSANENGSGLELCFRAARAAIAVCSEQSNNPEQRVDCLAKARADQLECINQALSAAANKPPEDFSKTARSSAPAAGGAATEAPDARKAPAPVDSVGSVPAEDTTAIERPDRTPAPAAEPMQANKLPSLAAEPSGAMRPDRTTEPIPQPTEANKSPSMAPEPSGAAMRPDRTPEPTPQPTQANKPSSIAPEPSGAIRPDRTPEPTPQPTQANKLPSTAPEPSAMRDAPMPQPDWVVSETTSPVDYSPLVNAVIRSTSGEKDGPNIFTVRCRAQRTEVSLGTNGAWGVPRGNLLQVDYQIDGQASVRQQWVLAADGKTATYKDDAVALLRSIPDGAALKVAVADKDNIRREALFQLAGLSAIRQKIAAACKWTPATARTSSDGR